jgi:hypothetical protein
MEMIRFQNIWLNGKDFLMQNLPGKFFLNRIYLIIFSAWFCMLVSWYIVNCIPTLFWILCCREKDTDIEFAQDAIDEYKVMYSVSI